MSDRTELIARKLKEIIEDLSGYAPEDLPDNSTFLELGFDSLFLTQLATAFQNEFQVKITFRQLFDELPSVAALTARLDAELPEDRYAPAPAPQPEPSPPPAASEAEPVSTGRPPPAARPLGATTGSRGGHARASTVQAVIAQQLDLMERQLLALGGAGLPSAHPVPNAPSADSDTTGEEGEPDGRGVFMGEPDGAPSEREDRSSIRSGFGPAVSPARSDDIDPRQRAHVDALVARYTAKTKESKERTQQYRRWHADPRTAAGFSRLWKEMVYPIWVERSSGSRLWDVDGNEYIDILNGFGPNFLGHSPPFVTEALQAQLERGIEVGPQTPFAGETAELFCTMTGMDRASFVNTGSEAVQAAIRLSRTVTGRDRIVVFRKDYHGNFDEVLVRGVSVKGEPRSTPLAPGIPRRSVQDVVALEYGADEALAWMREHGSEVAAVLVEPVQSRQPELQPKAFLQELRRITTDCGAVLVFDEVITGFRTGPGGAQAMFGVDADLATYGKVVGGGMPIGVVAGRARFMDTFDGGMWRYGDASFPEAGVTFFAGTFVRHPLAMAAANAVLRYLGGQTPGFWDAVNTRTTRFARGANELFERNGIDIEVPHCCSQMFFRVNEASDLATLLFYHLRDRGVHVLEGFPSYMTVAHTDADVDALLSRLESSVIEMQEGGIFPDGAAGAGTPLDGPTPSHFPLTVGQRDVWLASQVSDEASCAFNESDTIELRGDLAVEELLAAAGEVLERHQAFHLTFQADGSRQSVRDDLTLQPDFVDLSEEPRADRNEAVTQLLGREAGRPFDLENGPLVRALLIRLNEGHHLFVIYSHHLVFDGWSADVFMTDLAAAYRRRVGSDQVEMDPAEPFSAYQAVEAAHRDGPDGDAVRAFWVDALGDPPKRIDLPTDRARPTQRTFAGSTVHDTLDADVSRTVHETAKTLGVSVHAVLLSAFQTLVTRLSGQRDFVLGVPAAGQAATGKLRVVGYCVNLIPVRCRVDDDTSFRALARASRDAVLDGFEHQLADLDPVVRELGIERLPGRLPLVEIVFNYSGYLTDLDFPGLDAQAYENRRTAVFHDLFLNIVESQDGLVVDWDYNTELFDEETIRQWIDHLETILAGVAADPSVAVLDVPLIPADEQARLSGG